MGIFILLRGEAVMARARSHPVSLNVMPAASLQQQSRPRVPASRLASCFCGDPASPAILMERT